MAKIELEKQEEILTFPVDSILELKVEEAIVETVPGRNGDWEKVRFKFKILGIQVVGNGDSVDRYESWITRDIWGSVPFRLTTSPENKLRIWSEAIFRQELGVGFELDTDMFVGRKVRGLTSQYEAKTRDGQGNPIKRHQIEVLLPMAGQAPGGAAPAQSAAPTPPTPAADPWGAPRAQGWDEPPF